MKEGGGEIDEEMNTAHVWTNDGQNVVYITPKKRVPGTKEWLNYYTVPIQFYHSKTLHEIEQFN